MKNKIHYIITALLATACVYLAWQLKGLKEYVEVQTHVLHSQEELNKVQSKLNDKQGALNNEVYRHIEILYERK